MANHAKAIINDDVLREADRIFCESRLINFVRQAWSVVENGTPLKEGWHMEAICDHLEAVHYGEINRLLINIPPGTMKSTLVNVFFPAWEWARGYKHYKYLTAAHEQSLSIRDNLKMRKLIESDWFQDLWGIRFRADQNQKTYFENVDGGFRQATAVGSMTGKRGHRVIWDDPQSVEGSHSDKSRETAIRVFRETLPSRLIDPVDSAIIIVMQRLHEHDVSGEILEGDYEYVHLCLPMEYEPDRKCKTIIGFEDPRTEEGELLFPERFPREVVERDKKAMGSYAVAGQLQQRPAPKGGGIFREAWWRYYKVLPKMRYRVIYGDTANKTGKENDYTVFQCWGMGIDNNLYLIDLIRGKWEAPELLVRAKTFWNKHRHGDGFTGALRSFKIEDKASGTGLIQTLKKEHGVPVEGIQRDTDKVTRAYDVVPQVEAGFVYLPEDAIFLSDLISELSQFPNASHDDQVDPLMDAISDNLVNGIIDYSKLV